MNEGGTSRNDVFFMFTSPALSMPGTQWCSADVPCSHMVLSLVPEGPSVKHKLRVTTKKKKSNNQSRFKLSVALWPIFFLTVCLN